METIKIYVVYNDIGEQKGVGFTKGRAWVDATKLCSNPAEYVIKYQDIGWICKEYTILK